jgi:alkylation response protein AidB-like acyl-CoA dehydrogenase
MDFRWSAEEDAFRARVVDFLRAELPDDWAKIAQHGPGSREQTEFSLTFCPRLAEAGLLVPHWPRQYGGAGSSVWQHLVLGEEMWAAGEPRGPQYMNVNWIGPTLMQFGTDAQKARYLVEAAAGKAIWCQGFSEPSAGSDLFSLRTAAVRTGDTFVINGSKIWTSYAALADHCFLLARTGGRRREGLCIFLLDMDLPGITVRPIPSLLGEGDIHEVFFDDVVVPADAMLGPEGQAASIIQFALGNERVGIARYELSRRTLDSAVARLKELGSWDDPHIRFRAGQAFAACAAAQILVYQVADQRYRGLPPSADASLARVAVAAADNTVANFALEFLPDAFLGHDLHLLHPQHERAIAAGIASGATEIQLDIVATSYLQLPRESVR